MPESYRDYKFASAQDAAEFGAFCRQMGAKAHLDGKRIRVYRRISLADGYLTAFLTSTGRPAVSAQLGDWYTDENNP